MDVDFAIFSSALMDTLSNFKANFHGLYVNRLCLNLCLLFSFNATSFSTKNERKRGMKA